MFNLIAAIVIAFFVSDSLVDKTPKNNKSDKIAEVISNKVPETKVAEEKAINTCIEWGYRSAKRFESPKRDCINPGEKGCLSWRVTWQYQCIE